MRQRSLAITWPTCSAYVDGRKRENSSFRKDRIIVASTCWYDYVTNASILNLHRTTTSNDNNPQTAPGCLRTHICHLQPDTEATDILASTPPSSWRRPRGRPPLRLADQIIQDTQMSMSAAVTATHDRPSWRSLVHDATCPGNLSKRM